MNAIETSGKTVEDAVKAGLKTLGCEPSDVTIDILEYGSPGLFGMFGKLARVRLTVKEKDPDLDFEMPVFSLDQQAQKKPRVKQEPPRKAPDVQPEPAKAAAEPPRKQEAAPAQPVKAQSEPAVAQPAPEAAAQKPQSEPTQRAAQRRPQFTDPNREPSEPRRNPRKPRGREPEIVRGGGYAPMTRPAREPREPREQREPREPIAPRPVTPTEDLPPVDLAALSPEARAAYDFVGEMTKLMNVPVDIRIQESEGHLYVQMLGDTLGVLIGRRGETLDALQYLTSLQVNKGRDEYLRVTLDTEHYRARREEALTKLADRMATRVRKTGRRMALEPMNPYERRILHSALQGNPYVTTHSEGDEPYRRVIITLK